MYILERTPVIVRKEPRIIQQPQQIQVVRTIARPTYGM